MSSAKKARSNSIAQASQGTSRRESFSSQSDDPYKRTALACLRCRRRKTKCSGHLPVCRTCREGGHDCIYSESERKVQVPEGYLRDLEERLRAFEGASNSTPVQIPITNQGASQRDEVEAKDIDVNPLMEGLAHLVISPSGQKQYLGNSSSTSLGLRLRNFVNSFRGPMDCGLDIQVQYPTYNPAAWTTRRTSFTGIPKLPPYDFAKRLYAAQYLYIGTIFSFVSPEIFEQRLQQAYKPNPDLSSRETCLAYCQVLMIFAFGQLYSVNQWDGHDGPPGFDYFMRAFHLLPELHEEGSPLFVEVLSLVGYFMQNLNRRDTAFLYIGLALRMAISLGLHQEISDPDLDDVAKEHRRRLWWSVYSMDRILCAKSGNPITIMDEDIGVSNPTPLPGFESEDSSAITLLHYTELSRILGKIMNTIYRKKRRSGSTLIASVQSVMTSLSNWNRDVLQSLRFDFSQPERNTRESVSTFLHYYQCINMTARPLLFHIVQKRLMSGWKEKKSDWRPGWSSTTIATIEACIAAARDSTTMLFWAAKHNLVATYGYMDGEHAFSAAIVLVMINIAFPFDAQNSAAMDMALNVLRGIAERGNNHIRAQHQLLLNLRSMIMPAPPELAPLTGLIDPEPSIFAPSNVPALISDATLEAISASDSTTGDVLSWEEAYGNFDVTMDFDWNQWTYNAETGPGSL